MIGPSPIAKKHVVAALLQSSNLGQILKPWIDSMMRSNGLG